jgi:hypothetical protein
MKIRDQHNSAQQPGVMRQGDDVRGIDAEPHYPLGKAAVRDHEGPAFRVQQVHHLDAQVVDNAMRLEHRRLHAHPAPHQYPLVHPQTRKARLSPLSDASVAIGPDPVNAMPDQAMKVTRAGPVLRQPAHVRFELGPVSRVLHNPQVILLIDREFDVSKLVIAGSREYVEGAGFGTGIGRVPSHGTLEGLYRASCSRTFSHSILLAHD